MNKKLPTATFKSFTTKVKEARYSKIRGETPLPSSYRYLQVRVSQDDAHRLKAIIFSKGLLVQSVLIESLNLWMSHHGYPPIVDPGTARKKTDIMKL